MKKFFIVELLMIFSLLSYGEKMNFLDYMKDIDYIERVKKVETSNGNMEKLAIKYLEILEFIYFNEKKLGEDIEKISIKEYDSYINEIRNGELNKFLRKNGVVIPTVENIKWEIEKKTDSGKIIKIFSPNARIVISTINHEDRIEIIEEKIKVYKKMKKNPTNNPDDKKTYFEEISEKNFKRYYEIKSGLEQNKYNIYKKVSEE